MTLKRVSESGRCGYHRCHGAPVTLHRAGWFIWSEGWARPSDLLDRLKRGDLGIQGPARRLPILRSRFATLVQDPDEPLPWLIDWLGAELAASGAFPDVESIQGSVFSLGGPAGSRAWLLS